MLVGLVLSLVSVTTDFTDSFLPASIAPAPSFRSLISPRAISVPASFTSELPSWASPMTIVSETSPSLTVYAVVNRAGNFTRPPGLIAGGGTGLGHHLHRLGACRPQAGGASAIIRPPLN